MLAAFRNHDGFCPRMRMRLKTAVMGLGLVRLLSDAGMEEEARATLASLQAAVRGIARKPRLYR